MPKPKPRIDLSFAQAATLLPPAYDRLRLYLVGCGGTGSWLAPSVARIAKVLMEKNRPVEVFFLDNDTVEQKNIPRQNFCQAELGANKAVTLAARFSGAWGVGIKAISRKFSAKEFFTQYGVLSLIIGCVDNAAGRQEMADAVASNPRRYEDDQLPSWWLDCGNAESSGQVLLGNIANRGNLAGSFASRKICKSLPAPSLIAPDLLIARPEETISQSKISCAEIQLANDQSLAVNQRVAAEATDYLLRFCFGGLKRFATFFDLEAGSARSRYITPEEIGAVARKPVESLIAPKRK